MPGDTQTAALALKDAIEAAGLSDRPYLKEYQDKLADKDTVTALLKKLDGAETLIGKKRGIPETDDPKAWDEFLAKLRPEKVDDYGFKIEASAGGDEEFVKTFLEGAHHAGMSKAQLARLNEKMTPFFQARDKKVAEANAAREAEYEKWVKDFTGSADFAKKQERVNAALKELMPEAGKKFIDKLDDKHLALFAVLASAVLDKYAGEDDFSGKGGSGGGTGKDKAALTEEMYKLLASEPYKDFRHADHEKARKRFEELTQEIAKL